METMEEFKAIVLKHWNTNSFEHCDGSYVFPLWDKFYLNLKKEEEIINTTVVYPGWKLTLIPKDIESFENFVSKDLKEIIRPSNLKNLFGD